MYSRIVEYEPTCPVGPIPNLDYHLPGEQKLLWQGAPPEPIPFSRDLAKVLQIELISAFQTEKPYLYIVNEDVVNLVGNECKRWIIAIYAYLTSPNPVLTLEDFCDGILDEFFVSKLKKLRAKAVLMTAAGTHDVDPGPEFASLKTYVIKDIGDIFNWKYWFLWAMTPEGDLEYAQIPVECEPASLELFSEACIELLRNVQVNYTVPEVSPQDIQCSVSSSSSILNGKREKLWKSKEVENDFASDGMTGYVTYIQKSPGEMREAITLRPSESNSIRLIEKQVYHIVKNMEYSAYHADPEVFDERFDEFTCNAFSWYNRDLTKEGIAKPRELLKIMLDACEKVFPGLPAWKYKGIYNNLDLVFPGGEVKSTKRGHGLGMANALTTFMQCAAFHVRKCTGLYEDVSALFYNDDASIGSLSNEALEDYRDTEAEWLSSLGLLPKKEKTWLGRIAVLCENYNPSSFGAKVSYKNYVRLIPFSSCNILAAKAMANLTLDPSYGDPRWDLYEDLISFFGTESGNPEEASAPYSCGGWMNLKICGVDVSFVEHEPTHPSRFISDGARIGPPKMKPYEHTSIDGVYNHPISRFINFQAMPPSIERQVMVNQPRSVASATFSRCLKRDAVETWLKAHARWRRGQFNSVRGEPLSWREVIELVSKDSYCDILPPRGFIQEKDPWEVSIEGDGRFCTANPYLSVACFWSDRKPGLNYKVLPWPLLDTRSSVDVSGRKMEKSSSKLLFLPKAPPVMFPGSSVSNRVLTRRDWIDSYKVWSVWIAMYGNPSYPINPWVSGNALIHKTFEVYEYVIEANWHLFQYAEQLGWGLVRSILAYPELVDAMSTLINPEVPRDISPVSTEYMTFSEWIGSGSPPTINQALWMAYSEASRLLRLYIDIKLMSDRGMENDGFLAHTPTPAVGEVRFLSHLTKLEVVELEGKYYLNWPETDVFGDSDSEGGLLGMFDPG